MIVPVPFVCECADASCSDLLRLTLDEYRAIRAHPSRFLHAPGHQAETDDSERLIADRGAYVVVELTVGES